MIVDTQLLLARSHEHSDLGVHTHFLRAVASFFSEALSGVILLAGWVGAGWVGASLSLIPHCQPVFQVAGITHTLCLLITDLQTILT